MEEDVHRIEIRYIINYEKRNSPSRVQRTNSTGVCYHDTIFEIHQVEPNLSFSAI